MEDAFDPLSTDLEFCRCGTTPAAADGFGECFGKAPLAHCSK